MGIGTADNGEWAMYMNDICMWLVHGGNPLTYGGGDAGRRLPM